MDLLKTADVALALNVPVATVVYWRRGHAGPPWFKLGPKAVRYRRSDVEAFVAEQESVSRVAQCA